MLWCRRCRLAKQVVAGVGIGKGAAAEIRADHYLKPRGVEIFEVDNDPDFEGKFFDVVGLHMNMKAGRAGAVTYGDKRNGTIDVFAARNVVSDEVLPDLLKGHNVSAHSTPAIAKSLAHRGRRRRRPTPASSSWVAELSEVITAGARRGRAALHQL
ncbi:hypothetical protein AWC21_00435 [Mycolicibacterium peregrinum]|nr:hypothetical protein BHQ19_15220 [Mycolicibacterium porcinum]ORW53945.1 hypothetical protein AWC21_00435 [Mycolicibacterium peregrinum]